MNKNCPVLIAAASAATFAIGAANQLPWPTIAVDFAFMKYLTLHKPAGLIMGRKTFDSIGRVLPRRVSLVVSTTPRPPLHANGGSARFVGSIEEGLAYCREHALRPIIFGGASIYRQALQSLPCVVYLTLVHGTHPGDTFFPMELLKQEGWVNISEEVVRLVQEGGTARWQAVDGAVTDNGVTCSFFKIDQTGRPGQEEQNWGI